LATRSAARAGVLIALAAAASGCGAGGGTITVGEPAPAVPVVLPVHVAAAARRAVGPGAFSTAIARDGYRVAVRVSPNRASTPNRVSVSVSRDGVPVRDADVRLTANMETMDMGVAHYQLDGTSVYSTRSPAWYMPGRWQLVVSVRPAGAPRVDVALDDLMRN
jgi:hypothetical protein